MIARSHVGKGSLLLEHFQDRQQILTHGKK
jgi:hypothetical protein